MDKGERLETQTFNSDAVMQPTLMADTLEIVKTEASFQSIVTA